MPAGNCIVFELFVSLFLTLLKVLMPLKDGNSAEQCFRCKS